MEVTIRERYAGSPLRELLVIVTTVSLLTTWLMPAITARNSPAFIGSVLVRGIVEVNGQRAHDGQTLFANSTIKTGLNSESLINLINQTRMDLSPASDLTITGSERQVSGRLPTGEVVLDIPTGVVLDFSTADLSINQEPGERLLLRIATSECDGTQLTVMSGHVEARYRGRTSLLSTGETLSTLSAIPTAQTRNSSGNSKLGIFSAIGGAVAIVLAATLGGPPEDQQTPGNFGDCRPILSPDAVICR